MASDAMAVFGGDPLRDGGAVGSPFEREGPVLEGGDGSEGGGPSVLEPAVQASIETNHSTRANGARDDRISLVTAEPPPP
jgi:hypothetical protein